MGSADRDHALDRDAGALWDASEMGAEADVHCYTPSELERKREALRAVREAVDHGIPLLK